MGVERDFSVQPPELKKMVTVLGMVKDLLNSAHPIRLCLIKLTYTYKVH